MVCTATLNAFFSGMNDGEYSATVGQCSVQVKADSEGVTSLSLFMLLGLQWYFVFGVECVYNAVCVFVCMVWCVHDLCAWCVYMVT
jgi:hypothetical protein